MLSSVVVRRRLHLAPALVSWVIGALSASAIEPNSADAAMISSGFSESSSQVLRKTVDNLFGVFEISMGDWSAGSGSGELGDIAETNERPISIPTLHDLFKDALTGLEVSPSTSGSNTGAAGNSGGGRASSPPVLILCRTLNLSPPLLAGWQRSRARVNIPQGMPFELVRPPKAFI